MKKILFYSFLLILLHSGLHSVIVLEPDYQTYDFYGTRVRITNADNMAFTNNTWDDSTWPLIRVPSSWTKGVFPGYVGVAWYRIPIVFPDHLPEQALAIDLGKISDADETFLNGKKIGGMGSFTHAGMPAYDQIRIYEIPARYILSGQTNVLAVRVKSIFSDEAGMLSGHFVIQNKSALEKQHHEQELIRLSLIIAYLVIGAYFIFFFLRQKKNRAYLWFGILCLLLSIYFYLRSQFKIDLGISFLTLKRIEYLALTAAFPVFFWFITRYFHLRKLNWLLYTLSGVFGTGMLIILFSPSPVFWNNLNTWILQPFWLIEIISVWVILIRLYKNKSDARILFYSNIVFSIAVFIDMLIVRNILTLPFISTIGMMAPYGFALFILSIALVLSNSFLKLYKEVEIKTITLQELLQERDEAYEKVDKAYLEAMNRMAIIAEMRDPETGAHIQRVAHYVRALAEKAGYSRETVNNMYYAAPMHDVGKVGIPDRILFKAGPLTKEEWDMMKKHTEIGARIFANAKSDILKVARDIALTHHEKWSGGGYPGNLSGTDIPVSGRMMALADVYDALRSKRPYKPAFSHKKALDIIQNGDERLDPKDFDPELLRVFIENEKIFEAIYANHVDEEEDLSGTG